MDQAEAQKIRDEIIAIKKEQLDFKVSQKEILDILKPIAETYTTVSTLSKWFMGLAVFISITFGIWATWIQIKK